MFIEYQIDNYWEKQKQGFLEKIEKQKREDAEKRKQYKAQKQIDGQMDITDLPKSEKPENGNAQHSDNANVVQDNVL